MRHIILTTLLLPTLILAAIDSAEYSWDIAAAPGTGTALTITNGDTGFVAQRIPVSLLTSGLHRLFIRVHDDEFGWGEVESRTVYKFAPPLSTADSSRLSRAECFLHSDPGEGFGIPLVADDGIWDEANESASVEITPTLAGRQLVGVRFRDNLGQWSNAIFDTVDVDARLVIRTVGTNMTLHWTRGIAGQPFTVYRAANFDSVFSIVSTTADSTYSDPVDSLNTMLKHYYYITQTRP